SRSRVPPASAPPRSGAPSTRELANSSSRASCRTRTRSSANGCARSSPPSGSDHGPRGTPEEKAMSDPIRIHLRVPGTAPMSELLALIERIEAAGFDGVGILDSQMLCRDTFVILGQAAARTSRMALFPAVTNPFTRHASVLAGAIQTVEELAPGRVKFVIGTGYTSASTIGRKPATL